MIELFNSTIQNHKDTFKILSDSKLKNLYDTLPDTDLFQKYAIADLFFDRYPLCKIHVDWVIKKSDFYILLCEPNKAVELLFCYMVSKEDIDERVLFKFLHIHHRMKWNLTVIDYLKNINIDKLKETLLLKERTINLLKIILTENYDIESFKLYFGIEHPLIELIQDVDNFLIDNDFDKQCALIKKLIIQETDAQKVDCAIWRAFWKNNRLTDFFELSIWDGKNQKYKNDIRSCSFAKWILNNRSFIALSPDMCIKASYYLMESSCLTPNFESYQLLLYALKHNITNEQLYNRYLTVSSFGRKELPNYKNFNDISFSNYNLLRFLTRDISLLQWNGQFHQAWQEIGRNAKHSYSISLYPIAKSNISKSKKIKVALEISGQIRVYENELHQNIQNLLDVLKDDKNIEIDIYLSSWQQTVLKRSNDLRRLFGNKLFYLLSPQNRAMHSFAKSFPNTNKKLLCDNILYTPNSDTLSQFCKAIHLEQEEEFVNSYLSDDNELKLNANQSKMFYKIHNCHLLSSMHGAYDVCIRMRSDVSMKVANLKECIYMAYHQKNVVFTSYVTREGMGDQFAVLSKQAMDIYADIWTRILANQSFQYNALIEPNVGNEHLLLLHCRLAGLQIYVIPVFHRRLNSIMFADYFDLSEYLKQDLELNYTKEKELFVQTYLEMKKNKEPFLCF